MTSEKRKRYNDNWEFVSNNIRFNRAKNCCEKCGLKNGLFIKRLPGGRYNVQSYDVESKVRLFMKAYKLSYWSVLKRFKITRVVLTVAHLNHNEKDDRVENLKCLCQRCHLIHDKENNWYREQSKFISKKQQSIF